MPKINAKSKRQVAPVSKHKKERNRTPASVLIFAFAAGTAMFFLSIFAFSFLLEKSPDPNALFPVAAIASTVMTAATSGMVAAKLSGKASPWSILSGLILILFYLVISLFFDPANCESGMVMKSTIVVILPAAAFIAGVLCTQKKNMRKKR